MYLPFFFWLSPNGTWVGLAYFSLCRTGTKHHRGGGGGGGLACSPPLISRQVRFRDVFSADQAIRSFPRFFSRIVEAISSLNILFAWLTSISIFLFFWLAAFDAHARLSPPLFCKVSRIPSADSCCVLQVVSAFSFALVSLSHARISFPNFRCFSSGSLPQLSMILY